MIVLIKTSGVDMRIYWITILMAGLAACGGGGGSAPTLTGVLWDAPSQGVSYSALPSGLKGTTNERGEFIFQAGDEVNFAIQTTGGVIPLGSARPATPATGGSTILPVLKLPAGTQIVQVLQTLNQGNDQKIDVRNLGMSEGDVTALRKFIQESITPSTIVVNGTPKTLISDAVAKSKSLDSLQDVITGTPPTGQAIANMTIQQTFFALGFSQGPNGNAVDNSGFAFTSENGFITQLFPDGSTNSDYQWRVNDGRLTYYRNTFSSSPEFLSADAHSFISRYTTTSGQKVTSMGRLLTPLTYADWSGQTLYLSGNPRSYCRPLPTQIILDSTGRSGASRCPGAVADYATFTLETVPALPGVFKLIQRNQDGSVSPLFIGLLRGGSLSNGEIAVFQPASAPQPSSGAVLRIRNQL